MINFTQHSFATRVFRARDSLAAATNPAGMILVGDRFDFGLTWFRPIRGASITGSGAPGVDGIYDGSRKKNFFIPELGYNHLFNPKLAFGVSIDGNGGMNTAYTTPIPLFSGPTNFRAGVDLQQLFVSPTVAFKANAHNAFGVSLNIAYQKFSAQGLENFANPHFSSAPGNVTERGFSNSFGAGVRVGWVGTINQSLSLGATFQTRTYPYMQKFDKYKGLFAEQGGFDIPANVAGGGLQGPSQGDGSVRCRANFLRTGKVDRESGLSFPGSSRRKQRTGFWMA
jgi:long-chain fatty acid transport protein